MHVNDSKCFQNSLPKKIYQASKFSSHDFYLTTPKSIKYFKKHNFGWPQKLTHNHMYRVEQGFVCGV